jgi:hypothetical protein
MKTLLKRVPGTYLVIGVVALCTCCPFLVVALGRQDTAPAADPPPAVTVPARQLLPATDPPATEAPTVAPTETPVSPTSTPVPTVVPTATPIPATDTPVPVPTDTPPPPTQPPVACNCSSDTYNCDHPDARTCFEQCQAAGAGDVHRLDGDNDGRVCE